jgi:chaperonin GroEL (HSP60 family)
VSKPVQRASESKRVDDPVEGIPTAAISLSEMIQTTLGPNGMDKMVTGNHGTVVVSNDGSAILDWVDVTEPTGKVIKQLAMTQAHTVGDGATTAVILAGELLKKADSMRQDGLHPTTIIDGYAEAASHIGRRLPDYTIPTQRQNDTQLERIAETAVTGRWDGQSTQRFAALTVEALRRVDFDESRLTVESYSGSGLQDAEIVEGLVIDTDSSSTTLSKTGIDQPRSIPESTVAMINHEVGVQTPDEVGSVSVQDADQLSRFREHEETTKAEAVDRIVGSNADVLVCQKSVDATIRGQLSAENVTVIERTKQREFDAIAQMTGSSPVHSTQQLSPEHTGYAESVEYRPMTGTAGALIVRGSAANNQASMLLRGGTDHVAKEVTRIVSDCLDVVQLAVRDGSLLPGGGASAVALAMEVSAHASSISDKRQLPIDSFASALEAVPRVLARNAGQDVIGTIADLRQRHDAGDHTVGIDSGGELGDMTGRGILEPEAVLRSAITGAVETASMLLRIDDVLTTSANGDTVGESDHDPESGSGMETHATGGYPWAVGH